MGRLLVEAQGGEARAKYGNKLIKEYSEKLTKELGKGYKVSTLRKMRQFYFQFKKRSSMPSELSWSHINELLAIDNPKELEYYIYITKNQLLSYRDLRERIKSKEYERIGYKEELKEPKVNTLIKNPIIIKTKNKVDSEISEYALHELILDDMDSFFKELGNGFAYIGHEVKIKIGVNYHYIDFLLFNVNFNCYVIVEIKVNKIKAEYVGQIKKYMNYVDKNIKKVFHNKIVGVVICKREDKYVLEYCSDDRIFTTTYELK